MSLFACIASLVTTAPSSGSGASSGLKWLISFALPDLATLSCAITMPGEWVTAASRCTFLFPPAFAPLRSLPSTATPCRAGTCPGSPVTAGSSHGCSGCGRNQPSSRSWRKPSAAGGFRFRFFSAFFASSSFLLRRSHGRDLRVQRRVRQRPGQGGLEPVRVQALRDPVQRPRRRRHPQPRPPG